MKTTFLCPNHRSWLENEPYAALSCWHDWMDRAQMHFEVGQWKKAIPFYGCSLEAADILLKSNLNSEEADTRLAVDRFLYSAISLALSYKQDDNAAMQGYFLSICYQRMGFFLNHSEGKARSYVVDRMKLLVDPEKQKSFAFQQYLLGLNANPKQSLLH